MEGVYIYMPDYIQYMPISRPSTNVQCRKSLLARSENLVVKDLVWQVPGSADELGTIRDNNWDTWHNCFQHLPN